MDHAMAPLVPQRVDSAAEGPHSQTRSPGRRRLCARLEQFEDRTLLTSYMAGSVSDLIHDISAANKGGTNTITLAANTIFDLTKLDNKTDGPTGLPVIAANDNLTITGQGGDVIQRDTAAPAFRLFDVASGASLTLDNLTLQNGLGDSVGGAIDNQGSLVLSGVTVQNNMALGPNGASFKKFPPLPGATALGGGIYSAGAALTLQHGTVIQNNEALGGNGGNSPGGNGANGGNAEGGGIFVSAGTVTITSAMLGSNVVQGGSGGTGQHAGSAGYGFGGGVAIIGGTVKVSSDTVQSNTGGGVYIADGTVTLSNDTVQSNTGGGVDIFHGMVTLSSDVVQFNTRGGGISIDGATVTLSDDTVRSNTSLFEGGDIAIFHGTVTLCNDTVQSNTAASTGGGIWIEPDTVGSTIDIDMSTVSLTTSNTPNNIVGTYTLIPNC
jgi:hypothetical protein